MSTCCVVRLTVCFGEIITICWCWVDFYSTSFNNHLGPNRTSHGPSSQTGSRMSLQAIKHSCSPNYPTPNETSSCGIRQDRMILLMLTRETSLKVAWSSFNLTRHITITSRSLHEVKLTWRLPPSTKRNSLKGSWLMSARNQELRMKVRRRLHLR